MPKVKNIIISGGGTGGHLIPAFAIADALKIIEDLNIRFIGSANGIEAKLFKKRPEKSYLLDFYGLKRSIDIKSIYHNLFVFPLKFLKSIIKVLKIYRNFKPDIVVGTGGYSSAIPLLVALFKGIKIIIQEQNSIPGLVNRFFIKKANKACFGFKPNMNNNKNIIITGNPTIIKNNIIDKSESRGFIKTENMFTIFILGGSQGSVPLNNHFLINYKKYLSMGIQIIWQCGDKNLNQIQNRVKEDNIHLFGFTDKISYYYSVADLVICRAGALTLTELSIYNKACILVPFPLAAENHQLKNAQYYKSMGAAEIVEQQFLDTGMLENKVEELFNNRDMISKMENKTNFLSKPDAAKKIATEILEAIK